MVDVGYKNWFLCSVIYCRYLPISHPLLHKLTQDLGLEIEKFYNKEEIQKNDHRNYFKNQHVKGVEETAKLFSVADNELPFFTPTDRPVFGVFPPDGSPFEARCENTGMLLWDITRALYLSLPMNGTTYLKIVTVITLTHDYILSTELWNR